MPAKITKAELRRRERVHLLRTLVNYGPMTGIDVADRATAECDHTDFDVLPPISRRGVGQKLQSLALDGLVDMLPPERMARGIYASPARWDVTDKGREAARAYGLPAEGGVS